MGLYLDTSLFYHAYSPLESSDLADWVLNLLSNTSPAYTSEWTIIEMFRALKKQVNLGKLQEEDAHKVLDLFLAELQEFCYHNAIIMIPVESSMLLDARHYIFTHNLYAADCLHLISALRLKCSAFITFDRDFKGNLGVMPIINQDTPNFKQTVLNLVNAEKDHELSNK